MEKGPIGIFDSGFGGLTVLKPIVDALPKYDFIYFGDNARAPYGNRSFDTILEYTWQAITYLFDKYNCPLIILACNTASAKALRTIQQTRLHEYPGRNVIGVIRPTTESINLHTNTNTIGVFGTEGTISSMTYPIEVHKFHPDISIYQQACPQWVSLIENNEFETEGGRYFIKKYYEELISQNKNIDTIILGCTHYPILLPILNKISDRRIKWINQGDIVAPKLQSYLENHSNYAELCTKNGSVKFITSDNTEKFESIGSFFYGSPIKAQKIKL